MLTNGVCTVFRNEENAVFKVGVFPCMWQETEGVENKKYGENNADKAAVFIPDINADIRKKDFIFRGVRENVTDKELYNALVVSSISRNNFGSSDMQHLQLGVK